MAGDEDIEGVYDIQLEDENALLDENTLLDDNFVLPLKKTSSAKIQPPKPVKCHSAKIPLTKKESSVKHVSKPSKNQPVKSQTIKLVKNLPAKAVSSKINLIKPKFSKLSAQEVEGVAKVSTTKILSKGSEITEDVLELEEEVELPDEEPDGKQNSCICTVVYLLGVNFEESVITMEVNLLL